MKHDRRRRRRRGTGRKWVRTKRKYITIKSGMELKKAFSALKIYLLLLWCYIFGISLFFTVFRFSFLLFILRLILFLLFILVVFHCFHSLYGQSTAIPAGVWVDFASFHRTERHFEIKNIATCNSFISVCVSVQFTVLLFASIVALPSLSFGELHLPILYIVTPISNDILCHRGYLLLFASIRPRWKLS